MKIITFSGCVKTTSNAALSLNSGITLKGLEPSVPEQFLTADLHGKCSSALIYERISKIPEPR
jgi:hypothetical protein